LRETYPTSLKRHAGNVRRDDSRVVVRERPAPASLRLGFPSSYLTSGTFGGAGVSIEVESLSRKVRDDRSSSQHYRRVGSARLGVGTGRSTGRRCRRPDPTDPSAAACPTRAAASGADAKRDQPGACSASNPGSARAKHRKSGCASSRRRKFNSNKSDPVRLRFSKSNSGKRDPARSYFRNSRFWKAACTKAVAPSLPLVLVRGVAAATARRGAYLLRDGFSA